VSCEERTLTLAKETEQLQEVEKLYGSYVLKTDFPANKAPKEVVHDRYKDLALVEWAFRTNNTVQLEMRPRGYTVSSSHYKMLWFAAKNGAAAKDRRRTLTVCTFSDPGQPNDNLL
jgi:hypothetical protein